METKDFEAIKTKVSKRGFNAEAIGEDAVEFTKLNPRVGNAYSFIAYGNDLAEIAKSVIEYAVRFDIDAETYKCLGEDGHGENGAPYYMIDIMAGATCKAYDIIYLAYCLYDEAYGTDEKTRYSNEYLTLTAKHFDTNIHDCNSRMLNEGQYLELISTAMAVIKGIDFSNDIKAGNLNRATFDGYVVASVEMGEYGLTGKLDNGQAFNVWELSCKGLRHLAEVLIDEVYSMAKKAKSCDEM